MEQVETLVCTHLCWQGWPAMSWLPADEGGAASVGSGVAGAAAGAGVAAGVGFRHVKQRATEHWGVRCAFFGCWHHLEHHHYMPHLRTRAKETAYRTLNNI